MAKLKLTDPEVKVLLDHGEAKRHEDGSVRWASDNQAGKHPGSLIRKPTAAMANFNSETGMATRRQAIAMSQTAAQMG